jgi:GTP-binding protein
MANSGKFTRDEIETGRRLFAGEWRFVAAAGSDFSLPPMRGTEIAFAGRSNVGKSSLINSLVGVKGLAKTSATPGRTRLLNWFDVVPQNGRRLAFVDLPGYGYAKLPQDMRAGFGPLIERYVTERSVLKAVVVLVDARRGAEDEEAELIGWLANSGRPAIVVATKADKLSKNQRFPAAAAVRKRLKLRKDPILFSAETGDGVADLWRAIRDAADVPTEAPLDKDDEAEDDPTV